MIKTYLVELYKPDGPPDASAGATQRARLAAHSLAREGTPVRYVRSIFIPGDETCFHLFEGPSVEAIAEVSRRAQISYDRIVEAEQ